MPASLVVGALVRYHPRRSFGEIAESCLGKWGGRLLTLLLALFSLVLNALILEDVITFIPTAVLQGTPGWVVGLLFLLVSVYGAYQGGEVLARASVLILLATFTTALLIFFGLFPIYAPVRLAPFLGEGAMPVLRASIIPAGWYAEVWIFMELIALLDRPRLATGSLLWASATGSLVLTLVTLESLMGFGPELSAHMTYPAFSTIQQLTLGEFLERLEVVIVTIWLSGMVIKSGLTLWISHIAMARSLGIGNARVLLPWLGIAALGLTFLSPNVIHLFVFSGTTWTPLSLSLSVAIPGLLLVISWWKARRNKQPHDLGA